MKCTKFQDWLRKQELSGEYSTMPGELEAHLRECGSCAETSAESRTLDELLDDVKSPEPGGNFWDEYLKTVMEKTRQDKTITVYPLWVKRALIPAVSIVLIVIAVLQFDLFAPVENDEDGLYLSTLEFMFEEHEMVMEQNLFDPTYLFAVDEFVPEDWEEPPVIKNQ